MLHIDFLVYLSAGIGFVTIILPRALQTPPFQARRLITSRNFTPTDTLLTPASATKHATSPFINTLKSYIGQSVHTACTGQPSSKENLSLWSLLERNGRLLAHGRDDGDEQVLAVVELGLDLVTQLTVWDLDVILGVTVVGHQGQEAVVNVQQLVLGSSDVRNLHVVGGWRQVLQLLAGENVNGDQVDLGVSVLTGLRGRHVDDLTRSRLDDNVAVLSQSRTLHWESQSGTGIGGLKGVLGWLVYRA